MDQNRRLQILCNPKQVNQVGQIVSVNRAQIGQSHILKNGRRQQQTFDTVLHAAAEEIQPITAGYFFQEAAVAVLQLQVIIGAAKMG